MKVIVVTWRIPDGSVHQEQFKAEEHSVRTEPGWLKIDNKGGDGPMRFIPSDKICIVQFAEIEEPSRVLRPDLVAGGGPKAMPRPS